MKVVQCWDDGVSTDIQLIEILRRHNAKATFNLNAGLFKKARSDSWQYKGTEVQRLGWNEMNELYEGFMIANHSLSHPRLQELPIEAARKEIVEGRKRLQDFFNDPIAGFAYPYGTYNDAVMDILREAGHVYARTTQYEPLAFPPENPLAFHPTCKFNADDFWTRYEQAKECGLFYFWGHSYELIDNTMWQEFENSIARITADETSIWVDLPTLF